MCDAFGICGLMPGQLMKLCPTEFEIILNEKVGLMKITNPFMQIVGQGTDSTEQSAEDQMNMLTIANSMMGGNLL